MLDKLKKRLKSRTNLWNIIIGLFGILEVNYGFLRELLGEHYGWSYLVIMAIGFLLREITTKPVGER